MDLSLGTCEKDKNNHNGFILQDFERIQKDKLKVQYNARVRVLNFREPPLQPNALEILGWKATIFNKIIP